MMKYLIVLLLMSKSVFAGISVIPDKDALGNIVTKNDPFYTKSNYFFRGMGITCNVAANTTKVCEHTVIYPHVKFNGVHILNSEIGDKADLKVLDTAAVTYSLIFFGTAVPNAVLNQFGFNWNLGNSVKELLPYASDLYQGMRIVVEYTNNQASAKDIYINYYIHEQKE